MSKQRKSWVWQYAKRDGDKVFCMMCDEDNNNELSCAGGSTGAISRHLQMIHKLKPTNLNLSSTSSSTEVESHYVDIENENTIIIYENYDNEETEETVQSIRKPRKRQRRSYNYDSTTTRLCNSERTEKIHEAVAKLIAINQLPFSFCSSIGFKNFMSVVEPHYKPCKEEAIKRRLNSLKTSIKQKIKEEMNAASDIICTTDCWSSLSQESYITITAHIIDKEWHTKSYTLTTHEMEGRHIAENLSDELQKTFVEWGIDQKVSFVVTDNAKNITNAVSLLPGEISNVKCAAHTLQLAINSALQEETIENLIQKCRKVVGHFKHSNVAKQALENKQEQLGISKMSLLQSCLTRWNSTYMMLERLYANRCPISNVLADRTVTNILTAHKLEITENQWSRVECIVKILKPLQIVTTVFCGESHSPVSMVRVLIKKVLDKHLNIQEDDDEVLTNIKQTLIDEIKRRFCFEEHTDITDVSVTQIAAFLDPRYKDLEHEPLFARAEIRSRVKDILEDISPQRRNDEQIKSSKNSALEFLYDDEINDMSDSTTEFESYLAEPQLRFDLEPFEWWKTRMTNNKYSIIGELAKKFLTIPATSASSERCFSTAGNIVTSKRSCLLPENVNTLVFLYQNRTFIE